MSWGHGNIAAIGTAALNDHAGTNFLSAYGGGTTHPQVVVLKSNLREYRVWAEQYMPGIFDGVPSLSGNTTEYFDSDTRENVIRFQELEGLTVDGYYGQQGRNRMALRIGVSPIGYERLYYEGSSYINYNDTAAGMSGDYKYKLDHSWLKPSAKNTLMSLATDFKTYTGKKLQINDCCLIDGEDTPDHDTHRDGKDADIRNAVMTSSEEQNFLELCVAEPGVQSILFYKNYGIYDPNNKIVIRADHADHFHVDFA